MGRLTCNRRLGYPSGFTLEARFEAGAGSRAFRPFRQRQEHRARPHRRRPRPDADDRPVRPGPARYRPPDVPVPESRQIGILFQDHLLFPHLSVRDNLRFGHGRAHARPMSFGRWWTCRRLATCSTASRPR